MLHPAGVEEGVWAEGMCGSQWAPLFSAGPRGCPCCVGAGPLLCALGRDTRGAGFASSWPEAAAGRDLWGLASTRVYERRLGLLPLESVQHL